MIDQERTREISTEEQKVFYIVMKKFIVKHLILQIIGEIWTLYFAFNNKQLIRAAFILTILVIFRYSIKRFQKYKEIPSSNLDAQRLAEFNKGIAIHKFNLVELVNINIVLICDFILFELGKGIYIGYMCFLNIIGVLARFKIYLILKHEDGCQAFMEIFKTLFNISVNIVVISIHLQEQNSINLNWSTVFWPFWIDFALSLAISFSLFLIFCNRLYHYMFYKINSFEVFGSFWMLTTSVQITVNIYFFVQGLSELYDQKSSKILVLAVIEIAAGIVLFLILSFIIRKQVVLFLAKLTVNDQRNQQDDQVSNSWNIQSNGVDQNSINNSRQQNQDLRRKQKLQIPKFLQKFSDTYFQRVTEIEVNKIKEDHKNQQMLSILDQVSIKKEKQSNVQNIRSIQVDPIFQINYPRNILSSELLSQSGQLPSPYPQSLNSFNFMQNSYQNKNPNCGHNMQNQAQQYSNSPSPRILSQINNNQMKELASPDIDVPSELIPDQNEENVQIDFPNFKGPVCYIEPQQQLYENQSVSSISIQTYQSKCIICQDQNPNCVLMLCGHAGLCFQCAIEILNKNAQCPLCRAEIISVLQVARCEEDDYYKVIKTIQK